MGTTLGWEQGKSERASRGWLYIAFGVRLANLGRTRHRQDGRDGTDGMGGVGHEGRTGEPDLWVGSDRGVGLAGRGRMGGRTGGRMGGGLVFKQ